MYLYNIINIIFSEANDMKVCFEVTKLLKNIPNIAIEQNLLLCSFEAKQWLT